MISNFVYSRRRIIKLFQTLQICKVLPIVAQKNIECYTNKYILIDESVALLCTMFRVTFWSSKEVIVRLSETL